MTSPLASTLRIMMTTDAVGGAWTFSTSLARALVARECSVHLVVMGPPPAPHQLDVMHGLPRLSVEVTDLALEWLDPEGADAARARAQLEAIGKHVRPDIVHLNSYREAQADWDAPVLITAHSCVRSWWQACRGSDPEGKAWRTYVENVRTALDRAPWIAPTDAFRRSIGSYYSTASPGRTIWNGIEAGGPLCGTKEPFILAAGRLWDEAKNIVALDHAARVLDWPIRLAGTDVPLHGPDPETRGASPFVHLGVLPQDDLQAEMRRAAIFASPAVYEPFGLAVLEAARAGCALALADIPTFRELWEGAALFADPEDDRQFCDILARLRDDIALRTRLGGAAAERARRYTLAATTDGYLDAYQSVLSKGCALSHHRSQPVAVATGVPA